jgi:hypothetical protein
MEFVKCLGHPEEFYNLLRFRMGGKQKVIPKMDQVGRASLHPLPRPGGGAGCSVRDPRPAGLDGPARAAGSRAPLALCPESLESPAASRPRVRAPTGAGGRGPGPGSAAVKSCAPRFGARLDPSRVGG